MNNTHKKYALTLTILLLTGCASGTKTENMIPKEMPYANVSHPYSVRVQTAGGRDTQWWSHPTITDESFHDALFQSLKQSNVFKQVLKKGSTDYLLDVFITDVQQPLFGSDITVSVLARWKLIHTTNNRVLFKKQILTRYTAKSSESFVGLERMKLANEGAVRENILKGIQELEMLGL